MARHPLPQTNLNDKETLQGHLDSLEESIPAGLIHNKGGRAPTISAQGSSGACAMSESTVLTNSIYFSRTKILSNGEHAPRLPVLGTKACVGFLV